MFIFSCAPPRPSDAPSAGRSVFAFLAAAVASFRPLSALIVHALRATAATNALEHDADIAHVLRIRSLLHGEVRPGLAHCWACKEEGTTTDVTWFPSGGVPESSLAAYRDVQVAVANACGIPPALMDPASTGTGQREGWRRFFMGAVEPVAAIIAEVASNGARGGRNARLHRDLGRTISPDALPLSRNWYRVEWRSRRQSRSPV